MRQAVWKRKGPGNDHRDIGYWSKGKWYHFLEKGEECLGHKGKGDWVCHNHKGKPAPSSTPPKKKKQREKTARAPKKEGRENMHLMTRYQKSEGMGLSDEVKEKLARLKAAMKPKPKPVEIGPAPEPEPEPSEGFGLGLGLGVDAVRTLNEFKNKLK